MESNFEEMDEMFKNVRKSLKYVEVSGCILKNRIGSISKDNLKEYFEYSVNLLLRINNFLLSQLNDKDLMKQIHDKEQEELKRKYINKDTNNLLSNVKIFIYNLNVMVCLATIKNTSSMLGSEHLIFCIDELFDKNSDNNLLYLIKQQMKMLYKQSIDINALKIFINDDNYPIFVKDIMKWIIFEYLYLYEVDKKEKDQILDILSFKKGNNTFLKNEHKIKTI